MNLTSKGKLKQHIGIKASNTSKDALLEQIITGVSAFIESETNRQFGYQEITEVRDGDNVDEIFLKEYPVRAILSLSLDGREIDLDAEEEAGSVVLDEEIGSVFRRSGFGAGRKGLRITYSFGYDAPSDPEESGEAESGSAGESLPAIIEAAAIRLSARVYERRTAEGVASVSTGMSVTYKDALDSDITSILESNKKRRI